MLSVGADFREAVNPDCSPEMAQGSRPWLCHGGDLGLNTARETLGRRALSFCCACSPMIGPGLGCGRGGLRPLLSLAKWPLGL